LIFDVVRQKNTSAAVAENGGKSAGERGEAPFY
jgi:hypothetical protein